MLALEHLEADVVAAVARSALSAAMGLRASPAFHIPARRPKPLWAARLFSRRRANARWGFGEAERFKAQCARQAADTCGRFHRTRYHVQAYCGDAKLPVQRKRTCRSLPPVKHRVT